ncbi:MAG: transglutaminase-like domain-containing protein [Bacteroidia bacterium]
MNTSELNALISLLDDPDEVIYEQISGQILSQGTTIVAELELAWENSKSVLQQQRIENLIQKIQFSATSDALTHWIETGGSDLLEGALIIARYQFPDFNEKKIYGYIDQLKQDIWLELNPNLTALEQVRVINHILFEVHQFVGNTNDFHHPNNSFINMVLESKRGNPLSLSIIYAILAQKLSMPIYGVNLPQHFILAYMGGENTFGLYDLDKNKEVLFYINAFSKGTIFNRNVVESYLQQLNLKANENYFYPCNNIEMIKRMINNLIFSFEKMGNEKKSNDMKLLIKSFKN